MSMIKDGFVHKTYRCEWQVVVQQVDQYGCNYPNSAVVLDRWPTAEAAYNDLPNHGRWITNDAISNYEWLEVQYREVIVS